MTIDLLEDVAPSSNSIGAVADMAQQMFDLEKEIEDLTELLKQKKQNLTKLAEQDLPDLMQELNVKDFTLNNGAKVEVNEITSGSIPSAGAIQRASGDDRAELELRQQQCFAWLRANKAGDLIKSNVEVQFGRDEDALCNEFTQELKNRSLHYKRAMGVHPATINSFIKEKIDNGQNIPRDLFKVYEGRRAKIRKG